MKCEVLISVNLYEYLLTIHSISHSPRGWTDQELGSAWLEHDFEPTTAARNKTGSYHFTNS